MDAVAKENKNGVKMQGGKKYTQVVTRVEIFRRHFGLEYGIQTEIKPLSNGVLASATVTNPDGAIIGSGHAHTTAIQKDKSIEKCETTAIGRALASCGLSGGEYATENEIESHEERYAQPAPQRPAPLQDWEYDELGQSLQSAQSLDDLKQQWAKVYNARHRMTDQQFDFLVKVKDEVKTQLQQPEAAE
jgi:hypothetical protein